MGIHGRFGLRSWLSMIFGLLLFAFGGLPILNDFGTIDFVLPPLPDLIGRIVLVVAGALLLWDAKYEVFNNRSFMWLSIVAGIPILVLGLIPVLYSYDYLSFNLEFIPETIYNILTGIAGLILFLDAWKSE